MAKQSTNGDTTSTSTIPSPIASVVGASAAITITRHSRIYRNGRTGICMTIPQDVAELLSIKPGETMLVTAFKDGKGWARLDKADNVGG